MASASRRFKDAIYEQLAFIGKSLASGPRLEILDILCQGPRTVEGLASQVGQSVANTSHHLQVLRRARLVETERQGVYVIYRLADEEVCAFFLSLRRLAESRLLEIERVTREFLEARHVMQPVDRGELVERIKSGEVTVLDVRPQEEYRAGHIPGALSVPLDQLDRRMATLPRDRPVVVYCRGPYCVLAIEAVERLRRCGYQAVRFDEGIPDWRARGLPVEPAHRT
ncbi:MAG: metalloregulator ArsR/SmtB family transcription factor [Actinobacteria bacterium]|nr:metalloregulator ArsR/SmtB family transcription factor [Actinomycetota bacterium]